MEKALPLPGIFLFKNKKNNTGPITGPEYIK
jgi:hypothetical protein